MHIKFEFILETVSVIKINQPQSGNGLYKLIAELLVVTLDLNFQQAAHFCVKGQQKHNQDIMLAQILAC